MSHQKKETEQRTHIPRTSQRCCIEVTPTCGAVYSHPVSHFYCIDREPKSSMNMTYGQTKESYCPALKKPVLNTTMRQYLHMGELASISYPPLGSSKELSPRSKATIAPKITQKLNFHIEKSVFRNLPSLNVNDSILLPNHKPSIKKKYARTSKKVPVPDLCDFLEPLPRLTLMIDEPNLQIFIPNVCLQFELPSFDDEI